VNKTLIQWVKNPDGSQGYTWNPITGCLNGCPYCYARKLANGRLRSRYLANDNLAGGYPLARGVLKENAIPPKADPFYPRFWRERLYHPWGGKPRGIFTCDMSDLFGVGIPSEWTETVLNLCRLHSENRYYLLTKQPQNLINFSPFPPNCWVGVTVTEDSMMQSAYEALDCIIAKVKFISLEPYLSRLSDVNIKLIAGVEYYRWLDWLIIGSQTKPLKHPRFEYVEEIVNAADRAGIPVFIKPPLCDAMNLHRQEMPNFKG